MNKTAAIKPGTPVKPILRAHTPNHWAHALRGHVVRTTDTEILVKWDYEALGDAPLAPYWMFPTDVEVVA